MDGSWLQAVYTHAHMLLSAADKAQSLASVVVLHARLQSATLVRLLS